MRLERVVSDVTAPGLATYADLARLSGHTAAVLRQWRYRDMRSDGEKKRLPEPVQVVGGSPLWTWEVATAWAKANQKGETVNRGGRPPKR